MNRSILVVLIVVFFWILSLTDGTNSVEDIAKKSNLELDIIKKTIKILEKEKLVRFYEKVWFIDGLMNEE